MFKYAFIAVCSFAIGVLIMDTLQEPKVERLIIERQAVLAPIHCDATVEQRTKPTERWSKKCYVVGMHK